MQKKKKNWDTVTTPDMGIRPSVKWNWTPQQKAR